MWITWVSFTHKSIASGVLLEVIRWYDREGVAGCHRSGCEGYVNACIANAAAAVASGGDQPGRTRFIRMDWQRSIDRALLLQQAARNSNSALTDVLMRAFCNNFLRLLFLHCWIFIATWEADVFLIGNCWIDPRGDVELWYGTLSLFQLTMAFIKKSSSFLAHMFLAVCL